MKGPFVYLGPGMSPGSIPLALWPALTEFLEFYRLDTFRDVIVEGLEVNGYECSALVRLCGELFNFTFDARLYDAA